ncbi:Imm49 family immunity protein [Streptomyces sp. NPDC093586]|uniref:Imm49 family immunity protein n=1 Tax=Streptomyces sp. NPDC093586 TaxID=3366042 RepID=UPI0038211713
MAPADAPEAHRDYYQVADRADDPDASVNLDILVPACRARRRGWTIRGEFPRLPRNLLRAAAPFQVLSSHVTPASAGLRGSRLFGRTRWSCRTGVMPRHCFSSSEHCLRSSSRLRPRNGTGSKGRTNSRPAPGGSWRRITRP